MAAWHYISVCWDQAEASRTVGGSATPAARIARLAAGRGAEHGFERVEIGVGAQHEDAVEFFVLLDLIGIDPEVILADRLQVASITGVADQRFVALCELPLQCGYDRSAIGGILRRLLMVAADDIAPPGTVLAS